MKKIWNQLLEYLYIRKRTERANFDTRAMHWMNRISILVFLIALIVLLLRMLVRR